MAAVIVFSAVAFFCYFISIFVKDKKEVVGAIIISALIFITITALLSVREYNGTYKDGQVDAMNGKLKYERHIVYPENDTIPIDTLYVEITSH